jgi:hypothetical protein
MTTKNTSELARDYVNSLRNTFDGRVISRTLAKLPYVNLVIDHSGEFSGSPVLSRITGSKQPLNADYKMAIRNQLDKDSDYVSEDQFERDSVKLEQAPPRQELSSSPEEKVSFAPMAVRRVPPRSEGGGVSMEGIDHFRENDAAEAVAMAARTKAD